MFDREIMMMTIVFIGLAVAIIIFLIIWLKPHWFESLRGGGAPKINRDLLNTPSEEVVHLKDIAKLINKLNNSLDYTNARLETMEATFKQVDTRLVMVGEVIQSIKARLPSPTSSGSSGQSHGTSSQGRPLEGESSALQTVPAPKWAETLDSARAIYRQLVDGQLAEDIVKIFYAALDTSVEGQVIGELSHLFKQSDNKHSHFIIVPRNEREGWLFPNPTIIFTESMKMVFPQLSREQFENDKYHLEPLPVKSTSMGVWERSR